MKGTVQWLRPDLTPFSGVCVMAEAFRNVGELRDGRSRRHRLCVSVGDNRLTP